MGSKKKPDVHAAGALIWRYKKRSLQVLLIHRPRYDDWSWPKGKVHAGESLPACAIRETKEETGLDVVLGAPLPQVRYRLNGGARKVCWYWVATVAEPGTSALAARPKAKPAPKNEVDDTRWVDAKKALKLLTRADDREPLKALLDRAADGDLRSWALLLTRHGRAKSRSSWPSGDEATRPLTPTGVRQAAGLVPILAAYAAQDVVSSPWDRCAATVRPYAEAAGTDLMTAPEITEAAARSKPRGVKSLIADMLRRPHPNTVVCTHRPVLPGVLEIISERSPHRIAADLPAKDPYLRTGEVLVVHIAQRTGRSPRVTALERHRPCF